MKDKQEEKKGILSPRALDAFLSNFRSDKRKKMKKIIDYLLNIHSKNSIVLSRQRDIGDAVDLTRQYLNQLLRELKHSGIILSIEQRGTFGSIYQLNEGFFSCHRSEFAKMFPVLKD